MLECDVTTLGFAAVSEATSCEATALAINAAVQEFRGPSTAPSTLQCALGSMFYTEDDCEEIVATLNEMTEAWQRTVARYLGR
jgi:hypothetical protein